MERKKPLRADPEKTRAWKQRSQDRAASKARDRRTGAPRRAPLKPGKRKAKATIPRRTRERVKARTEGRCACGCGRPGHHLHHILDEQIFPELATEERNLMLLNVDCHMRHTTPGTRDTDKLPRALAARTLGPLLTVGPRSMHLDRHYR